MSDVYKQSLLNDCFNVHEVPSISLVPQKIRINNLCNSLVVKTRVKFFRCNPVNTYSFNFMFLRANVIANIDHIKFHTLSSVVQ
jgi:hypothetical protein